MLFWRHIIVATSSRFPAPPQVFTTVLTREDQEFYS